MNSNMNLRTYRQAALTLLALVLLGQMFATTATAQSSAPAATAGKIVVDSYDCETGLLKLHVPVTNLPHVDYWNGSLGFEFNAHYEQGPDFNIPPEGFNPPPELAPYTGNVYLDAEIPSTRPGEPLNSVTSIDLRVVAWGDVSTTTYTPECGGSDDLMQQLIAELVRILQSILNG